MTKELRKAIMDPSRLKNKYLKWPSRENFLAYKKVKNICNSLNNKLKKDLFKKIILIDINGNIVEDEQKLTKEFNSYYTNIAKTTSGKPPMKLENNLDYINDSLITKRVIEKYKNHPSIKAIQDTFSVKKEFKIEEAMVEQINKTLRNINSRKATGPDKIPPKIVKMSANIIDSHLTNIINSNLKRNAFSDSAKVASSRPIFKGKGERPEIKSYRPVSIVNCFSKVCKRFIHENLMPSVTNFLPDFISVYRKGMYSSNHVLLRLTQNWKPALDSNLFTGAVLMHLSKAFDCIPNDLLIVKLHPYGFSFETLTFLNSYLRNCKQCVKINICSNFLKTLSGVPQGSILGPILFNIFLRPISDDVLC